MAPSTKDPIVPAAAPANSPEAQLIASFFAGLFSNTEKSLSMLDPAFIMQIMPGSLKVAAMKRAEYVDFLNNGLLSSYKEMTVTPVAWTVDSQEETVTHGARGRRVVVEARSSGVTHDGETFGQEYYFTFVVSKAGTIVRIQEYVDSWYMARWTATQAKKLKAKA